MAKLSSKTISLSPPSNLADILAADGEIADFRNIPWLSPEIPQSPDADTSAGSSSSASSELVILSPSVSPLGVALPAGASLIALHTPAEFPDSTRYLFLASNNMLGFVSSNSYSPAYIASWPTASLGTLLQALPFGNLITLIGSAGMAHIIFTPSSNSYFFTASPPRRPNLSYAIEEAMIEEYGATPGMRPVLHVDVAMRNPDLLSVAILRQWLEEGNSSALTPDQKGDIMSAVAAAALRYTADVRAAGLHLLPLAASGALAGALPDSPTYLPLNYLPPHAFLTSWSYEAEHLYLNLEFSLLPYSISATYSPSAAQQRWHQWIDTLQISLREAEKWWSGSDATPVAEALSSVIDTNGVRRRAFSFNSLSAAQLKNEVLPDGDDPLPMRIAIKTRLNTTTSTYTITLPPLATDAPAFIPEFIDNATIHPLRARLCDEGVILCGGEMEYTERNGRTIKLPLTNSILAPVSALLPMVYRYPAMAGDARAYGIVQGNGRRSSSATGRHPLLLLSADGLRLLNPDGKGGYMSASLLSRLAPLSPQLFCEGRSGGYFISSSGLHSFSATGTISDLAHTPPEVAANPTSWELFFHEEANAIIIANASATIIFDISRSTFTRPEFILRAPLPHRGALLLSDPSAGIATLSLTPAIATRPAAESTANLSAAPPNEEAAQLNEEDAEDDTTAYLLTRPLKLGDPLSLKRIAAIDTPSLQATLILEGSNNLQDWTLLATSSSTGHLSALHLPSYRFHRLHLTLPAAEAATLRIIQLQWRS